MFIYTIGDIFGMAVIALILALGILAYAADFCRDSYRAIKRKFRRDPQSKTTLGL